MMNKLRPAVKQRLAILSVILIVVGFGMMHSVKGWVEVLSLLMIGAGTLYLFLLIAHSRNDNSSSEINK